MNNLQAKRLTDRRYLARTFYSEASARLGTTAVIAFLGYMERNGRRFACGCTFGGRALTNVMVSNAHSRSGTKYFRFRCLRHHRAGAAASMRAARRREAEIKRTFRVFVGTHAGPVERAMRRRTT